MNNKGLSYIDWSISIGIFVIFILALFIVVVPSLDRRLDERYLVSVAETGVKEETYHTIFELPLFVYSSYEQSNSQVSIGLPDYPNSEMYSSLALTGNNFDEKNIYFSSNINFGPVNLLQGVNIFNVLYITEGGYIPPGSPYGDLLVCGAGVECTFGIEEKLVGFSEQNLEYLFEDSCTEYPDYVMFKEKISYPDQKDLSILIYEGNLFEGDPKYNCTFNNPEELDSVYALSWRDNILDFNGLQKDISVLIRTW